jgi:hypothetical protein
MTQWQAAGLVYFLYVVLVAASSRARRAAFGRALAGGTLGVLVVFASRIPGQPAFLADWLWPALVLLVGYWVSGLLFTTPIAWQENLLIEVDRRTRVVEMARRTPHVLAEIFEAAYAGVYVLVPVALLVRYLYSSNPDPHGFWSVVLITDFICFAMLPWVQTRPPRAFEAASAWGSVIRRFNVKLLGATSIQVNTFPSGHAAEGLVAALMTLEAPPAVTLWMFAAALAVSAGAVMGRYHFFTDALAGWAVALGVWAVLT